MNMLNDNELDALLRLSAQRRRTVAQLNRSVMRTVRKERFRSVLCQSVRLIVHSFVLPACLVLYVYVLVSVLGSLPRPLFWVCTVFPLAVVLLWGMRKLKDYSPIGL